MPDPRLPPKRCSAYNIDNEQCMNSPHGTEIEHRYPHVSRKELMRTGRELLDLAEELNGDPSSCSYNAPIGERLKELRLVFK